MEEKNAVSAFSDELDALILRYSQESDIKFGEVIATMEMKKLSLMLEANKPKEE